jgi:hypothetical protein
VESESSVWASLNQQPNIQAHGGCWPTDRLTSVVLNLNAGGGGPGAEGRVEIESESESDGKTVGSLLNWPAI